MTEPEYAGVSIFETPFWFVVLHVSDQTYLGRSVVVLKRSCGDLAEVTEAELLDFLTVVRRFEGVARAAFGARMFNWACLMNDAYQETDPKPQVHWHVRPRYDHPVVFAGETFDDTAFGHHSLRGTERVLARDVLEEIASELRKQ